MKRFFLLLLVIGMMTTTMLAQSTIPFVSEIGCEIGCFTSDLVDIIAKADTLYDDKEVDRLIAEYDDEFPSSGEEEPAVLILIPDDEYFKAIFIQEDPDGEILTLRILTEDGWLECDAEPYSRDLLDLASLVAFVQHIIEVEDSRCCY